MLSLIGLLGYLRLEHHATPDIGPNSILLTIEGKVEPEQCKKALAVARAYAGLLAPRS